RREARVDRRRLLATAESRHAEHRRRDHRESQLREPIPGECGFTARVRHWMPPLQTFAVACGPRTAALSTATDDLRARHRLFHSAAKGQRADRRIPSDASCTGRGESITKNFATPAM